DYTHIQQLLTQARSHADAAEAHGTLAGCLCGAGGYRFEDWLREILPEGRAEPAVAASLHALYAATADALLQPDMEFELLLPDAGAGRGAPALKGAAHGERRVCAPPPPVDAPDGTRLHCRPARSPGAAPEQRRRVSVPPGQRLSLPHRLRRA